jgi:hypothetical protein
MAASASRFSNSQALSGPEQLSSAFCSLSALNEENWKLSTAATLFPINTNKTREEFLLQATKKHRHR